ncbi:8-oxo-dGTP pyrophosphatase MutT (NUDIX family) [Thermomonas haemolytica]|uniref:8-oxo-dGTP pyrophosphatase MutT (NUDIX family) n=1 Tax=Thermomonas haemolytica TaxID=141949 RepID=A0A4R3NCS2_9GAMM|nr:8-oxo-dGTP pyrophosphatase MutT (NUDIX family) [Thermomonas haemolytica]
MQADLLAARLRQAVHPLARPPQGAPWNLAELDGLPLPAVPRPAAVLVGVIPRAPGATVLLTRRNERLRQHAGQVSFPGGRVDPADPGPVATALREAHEEVGLEPAQAHPLGYLDPLLTITGFRVQPVLALLVPDFRPRPEPDEVADVFEVPLELLLDPARLETIELQFGGRTRRVFQYDYPQQRIWGATASILFNLRQRLATADNAGIIEQRSV